MYNCYELLSVCVCVCVFVCLCVCVCLCVLPDADHPPGREEGRGGLPVSLGVSEGG